MRARVGGRQKSIRTLAPSGSSAANRDLVVIRGSMKPVSPGRLTTYRMRSGSWTARGMERFRRLELPAHRDALGQAAGVIGQQFPGQPQQGGLVRGDGQLARFRAVEQLLEEGAVFGGRKEGVVQPAAPLVQLLLDALGASDRSAVRQVHVLFEIPAQVLVVVFREERREVAFHAQGVSRRVGELHAKAVVSGRTEADADFLQHDCLPFPPLRLGR